MEEIKSSFDSKMNGAKRNNYHKNVNCGVCGKLMRDNNIARHMRTHLDLTDLKDDDAIRIELEKRKGMAEEREKQQEKIKKIADEVGAPASCYKQAFSDAEGLEEELQHYNDVYLQKLARGKQINDILCKGEIMVDSLPIHHKQALDMYVKSRRPMDLTHIELRPWQQALLEKISTPTDREVIWVQGVIGNEGKTFFQTYIQSLFGYSRVVQLDLKSKTANILHALRKFPLTTADIFLFNDARATNYETCCYTVLEMIKDGSAVASKFNSERIQFKTPNIVVVFSNAGPKMNQLSKDRWKVYFINKDGLSSQEERLWKSRSRKPNHTELRHGNFETTTVLPLLADYAGDEEILPPVMDVMVEKLWAECDTREQQIEDFQAIYN